MTDYQFDAQIERLRGAYGKNSYPLGRVELIESTVRHISGQEFERIVTEFISSHRQAPLPKDFREAIKSANRYTREPLPPWKPECSQCIDSGVLRLQSREESIDTLCICECKQGEWQPWKLPTINTKIRAAFVVSSLPYDWFKAPKSNGKLLEAISTKAAEWNKRVREQESWWESGWRGVFD